MHFQPVPIALEPRPDLRVLMIRSVVLNQDSPLSAVAACQLFQEAEIGDGIEDGVLAIVEARMPQLNGAEDFHILAFAGDRDFRWTPYAAPGGVERRVLPETGFVRKDERPVSRAGFFLSAG